MNPKRYGRFGEYREIFRLFVAEVTEWVERKGLNQIKAALFFVTMVERQRVWIERTPGHMLRKVTGDQ